MIDVWDNGGAKRDFMCRVVRYNGGNVDADVDVDVDAGVSLTLWFCRHTFVSPFDVDVIGISGGSGN